MNSIVFTADMRSYSFKGMTLLPGGVAAAFAVLLSACVPPHKTSRPPLMAAKPQATPIPTQTWRVPTVTPTPILEESSIGEGSALVATPVATSPVQTQPPSQPVAGEVATAYSGEPESLLPQINASTPPNVAAALRLIEDARQQMREQGYDAALDRLERAVAIDPTSAYGYYFLAQVHFLKKNYGQAVAFASRAASLGRRADPVSQGRIYGLQGAVFEQVGRFPDARRAYQEAIAADPNNLAARVGLARLSGGQ